MNIFPLRLFAVILVIRNIVFLFPKLVILIGVKFSMVLAIGAKIEYFVPLWI